MKILVSDVLEQSGIDILVHEGFEVHNRPGISHAELRGLIEGYDALIVRSASKVDAEVIKRGVRLKIIGRAGTGVDNIDVESATRQGVLVMNTPGGNTISAAEHTVSMLLSLARNIPQANMSLRQGQWERKRYTGTEVLEKTLGLIGLGKIGREVANRCLGLGMKVVGYDPILSSDVARKMGIEPVTLDELYRRSDFISVHTPLTDETRGLINDATLGRCKRGVRIINCARGGIVDEQALLRGLNSGQVGGAALDVFASEPPGDSPLIKHERVISTPHLGASTEEAQEKVAVQIAQQIADALHGRGYAGLVNGVAIQLSTNPELTPYVTLAERMGSLAAQLASGRVRNVSIGATGELLTASLPLLKVGVLKGLLSHVVPDTVNFVNAPVLASEMGVQIHEHSEHGEANFVNLVRLRYETEGEAREVAGTVFGSSTIRLVRLDGFGFEVRPEGFLLVYNNIDRPGMLASVGGVLARHGVNIAGVSLGRAAIGGYALTVMNLDSDLPPEAFEALTHLEGVSRLRKVRLDLDAR